MSNAFELVEFFGAYLNHVNAILLRISLREDRPEWPRGKSKLLDLPRWGLEPCEHLVTLDKRIKPNAVGDRIIWVVEELCGGWELTTDGFVFSKINEAILFKLRWS